MIYAYNACSVECCALGKHTHGIRAGGGSGPRLPENFARCNVQNTPLVGNLSKLLAMASTSPPHLGANEPSVSAVNGYKAKHQPCLE
jgi:hypothetical protein